MGSRKQPVIPESEIVARYLAGEGRAVIGLRARIPDSLVKVILLENGVRLRTRGEAQRLSAQSRANWQRWLAKKRQSRQELPRPGQFEPPARQR